MRLRALLPSLFVAAACAGPTVGAVRATPPPSPSSVSSPSPSPSPRPAGLLFAVLENKAGQGNDTVAIVGLDGFARAKQRFTPRAVPALCDAAMLTQPEAHVAAGKVLYMDGGGVVRSLDPTGAVSQVASFSLQAQQVWSFGVDPTGHHLLGARLTIPQWPGGPPCQQQQGQFAVDLFQADAGQHPQSVYHQTYAQENDQANFLQAVGWDPAGALILEHTALGTQNGPFQRWTGRLAHWTPQGIGSVVGGSDCTAQDEVGNSIACISSQGEGAGSVRGPDGSIQWNLPSGIYYFIVLAPDGTRAAYCNSSECGVAGQDGSHSRLPAGFTPNGWLDGSTVIGVPSSSGFYGWGQAYGEMQTVSLSDTTKVNDLGFKGMFAGVVQAS